MPRPSLMERVKELRREEKKQRAIAFECFNFRPDYAELFDAASEAADEARERRAELLKTVKLHHLAQFHHEPRSSMETA